MGTVPVEDIMLVVRNYIYKNGGAYIGASAFYPVVLRKKKLMIKLNERILNIMEKFEKIQAGDLMQFKHETFKVEMNTNDQEYYKLNLLQQNELSDLEMLYIQNPLDLEVKQAFYIKNGQPQEVNKIEENICLCQYHLFEDHIDYYAV